MSNLENDLETLRKNYPLIKVNVYDTIMVYHSLNVNTVLMVEKELNELITKLNLNLIAEQSSSPSSIRKCVLVKEKI